MERKVALGLALILVCCLVSSHIIAAVSAHPIVKQNLVIQGSRGTLVLNNNGEDDEDKDKIIDDEQEDKEHEDEQEAAEEEHSKADAEAMIAQAQNKIDEVQSEIDKEKAKGGTITENIREAEEDLAEAKSELNQARTYFDSGNYEEAYEHAEEALDEAYDAHEELYEETTGQQTGDSDKNETAIENMLERTLSVIVSLNGEEVTRGTTSQNPIIVSKGEDVELVVSIKNDGSQDQVVENLKITTKLLIANQQFTVGSFSVAGASLQAGHSTDVTLAISTGVLGRVAEALTNPVYVTIIKIDFENWDYDLVIYWQAI